MKVFTFWILLFVIINHLALAQDGDGLEFYVKAEQLRKAGQFRAAIDEYNKAIKDNPNNYKFIFQKGKCYISLRDEDNAIAALEQTVALKEDYVHAYTRLAWLYQRKELFNRAIQCFDNAFKYETERDDRIEYKASIIKTLYKLNRFDEAGSHIEDALKINPQDKNILHFAAKFQNMKGNYAVAKGYMETAIALLTSAKPNEVARFYFELGYALYELEDFKAAFEAFTKADYGPYKNKIARRKPQYQFAIASSYFAIFEYDKCEEILDFILKMASNYSLAHDLKIKLAQARTNKGIIIEQTVKVVNNSDADVNIKAKKNAELAKLHFESKNFAEAIKSADESLTVQPHNYNVGFIKAMSMFKLGQLDASIATLKDLLTYQGLDFETKAKYNFALGQMYKSKGDKRSAIKAYKASIYGTFKYAAQDELRELHSSNNKGDL